MKLLSVFTASLFGLSYLTTTFAAKSFSASNLYYAAGLKEDQQTVLLEGLQSAGVKVLRVWLDGQSGETKGTPIDNFNGLQGVDNPSVYDDTVLNRLDGFMVKAHGYGIKLLISIHSYNALEGNRDFYGKSYGTGDFYTNEDAIGYFKERIAHVLTHKNPTNNKSWAESSEYIFAFEAQNEAMHPQHQGSGTHLTTQQNPNALTSWQCTMAQSIKDNLAGNTNILVSTGGGAYLSNSLLDPYFSCTALDVLAIHAYGVGDFATSALQPYVDEAKAAGKMLIMQEWGACYTDASNNNCNGGSALDSATRDANIKKWAASIDAAGIPWFYWQILPNPDPHQGWDYEVGVDDVNWGALKEAGIAAGQAETAWDFSKWLL
ncbi:glycoside hydrolase family 5 protein [Plenodomus tracheiphilus IPT5]|uniref:mannan endo-1,4-beta-mannosidase n=1 Tax=Plenodomus tracheiphilus IPT5 TaxID=1408161 RepID=A0A6A7B8H2_9PLEO|nr:glycoside hydrolase family 5 protein [Plenodomus tracheiphilus IPT5]